MSIRYTQTSNKCVDRSLRDKIAEIAATYSERGTLHIGYAVQLNDLRESSYIPDDTNLPTLVVCSRGKEIVDIKGTSSKIKSEAITALKDKFILEI